MSTLNNNPGMTKYDLIWELANRIFNEEKDKSFLEKYALCHALVNAIDSNNAHNIASIDLKKILNDYLSSQEIHVM